MNIIYNFHKINTKAVDALKAFKEGKIIVTEEVKIEQIADSDMFYAYTKKDKAIITEVSSEKEVKKELDTFFFERMLEYIENIQTERAIIENVIRFSVALDFDLTVSVCTEKFDTLSVCRDSEGCWHVA